MGLVSARICGSQVLVACCKRGLEAAFHGQVQLSGILLHGPSSFPAASLGSLGKFVLPCWDLCPTDTVSSPCEGASFPFQVCPSVPVTLWAVLHSATNKGPLFPDLERSKGARVSFISAVKRG